MDALNIRKRKKCKKIFLFVISFLVLATASITIYYFVNNKSSNDTYPNNTSTSNDPNLINSGAKTEEEKINDSSVINTSNEVTVVVVDASQYDDIFEVRAYLADVVEGGTCTFSFTSGENTVTKTSTAVAGSNTSSCTTIDIPTNELSISKNWTLKITYLSLSGNFYGETSKNISINQ